MGAGVGWDSWKVSGQQKPLPCALYSVSDIIFLAKIIGTAGKFGGACVGLLAGEELFSTLHGPHD